MFSVRWTASALNELAAIWTDAELTERRSITAATDRIDLLLSSHPENEGESRTGARRITFVPPLVVVFSLKSQQRVVRILHVWRYGST